MLNIVVSQICHRFTDYKTNLFEIKFATDSQIIKYFCNPCKPERQGYSYLKYLISISVNLWLFFLYPRNHFHKDSDFLISDY